MAIPSAYTNFGVLGKNDILSIYQAHKMTDTTSGQTVYDSICPGACFASYADKRTHAVVDYNVEHKSMRYITKAGRTINITQYTNAIQFHGKNGAVYYIDLCIFPDNRVLPRSGTPCTLRVEVVETAKEALTDGTMETSVVSKQFVEENSGIVRNFSTSILLFMYLMYYITTAALMSEYLSREVYLASMLFIVGCQYVVLLDTAFERIIEIGNGQKKIGVCE
jgi:hypothetical protein